MTIKEWYEINGAVLLYGNLGEPLLWIEENADKTLTVVDTNASSKELGCREDSEKSAITIIQEYQSL